MRFKISRWKLSIFLIILASLSITQFNTMKISQASPTLFLNLSTDKQIYNVGDTVNIEGNVTLDGTPVSDALVSIQVNSPYKTPYVLRTAQTGPIQNVNWELNITELYPCDLHGNPQDTFERGSMAYVKIKWKNHAHQPKYAVIALYIEYSTKAPCKAFFPMGETPTEIPPQTEQFTITQFEIPSSAPLGTTTIYANIYTQTPKKDGNPHCPEKITTFKIASKTGVSEFPATQETQAKPPNFNIQFSLRIAKPGSYDVYATTRYQITTVSNLLTFAVLAKALEPTAYFVYSPLRACVNMNITFDASPSLAEGYNDTIISYEWNFGDGTPPIIINGTYENPPNPTVTHIFEQNGTYTVILNVTDSEGLWNVTSKPMEILLTTGPIANFTWSPSQPRLNQIVTFDASSTEPGWNGTEYSPIVSYYWDFGDGNTATLTSPTIDYTYSNSGNYTVTLRVTDLQGFQDEKTAIITVLSLLLGDVDENGRVNMVDIGIVCDAFGSTPEKPNWDPRADLDGNGRVDMVDIGIVCDNFGKTG